VCVCMGVGVGVCLYECAGVSSMLNCVFLMCIRCVFGSMHRVCGSVLRGIGPTPGDTIVTPL
jgi:hypothetical protein